MYICDSGIGKVLVCDIEFSICVCVKGCV